jgi:hypothetical protein
MIKQENRSGEDLGSTPPEKEKIEGSYPTSGNKPNSILIKGLTATVKNQLSSLRDELKVLDARWEGGRKKSNGKYPYPDRLFYSIPIEKKPQLLQLFFIHEVPLKEVELEEVYIPLPPPKHVRQANKIGETVDADIHRLEQERAAEAKEIESSEWLLEEGEISQEEYAERVDEIRERHRETREFLTDRMRRNNEAADKIFIEGERKRIEGDKEDSKLAVDHINASFAIVETPQFGILEEVSKTVLSPFLRKEMTGKSLLFHTKADFKDRFQNQVILPAEREGKAKSKASIWLNSTERRTFHAIDFRPDRPPGKFQDNRRMIYNTWPGFSIQPKQGRCDRFKNHLLEVICFGDRENFQFLWNLFAHWMQKPWERTVAPVFRGVHGSGKGVTTEVIGEIFGSAYLLTSNHEQVFGRFNASLLGKALVHLDEAMFGGDRRIIGQVKGLITSPTIPVEMKGRDPIPMTNAIKVMISSNETFAIPVDATERRFFFFDVSAHKKGDFAYFNELIHETRNGGLEALLYDLLHTDISHFNPMQLPSVQKYGFDNKIQSANTFVQYLHQALLNGTIALEIALGKWVSEIRTEALFESYLKFCEARNLRPIDDPRAGSELQRILGKAGFVRKRKRYEGELRYCYLLPSLDACREAFADHFKAPITAIFEGETDA